MLNSSSIMDKEKWLKKRERALKENDKTLLYDCCKNLAGIYIEDDQYEKALNYYKEGLSLCEKTVDVAIMNRMIGEVYCLMGEFGDAIKHQEKHLELSKQEENSVEIQRALATLGRTYFVKGETYDNPNNKERLKSLQISHEYYFQSLQTCYSLTEISSQQLAIMKSRLYLNTGLTLEALGKTEDSIQNIQKAILIYKNNNLNSVSDLAQYHFCLASIYFKQQKHNEALNTIQKSFHLTNIPDTQCELLLLKSEVYVDLFDFQSAKSELIKAYKLKNINSTNKSEVEKKIKIIFVLLKNEKTLLEVNVSDENKNLDDIKMKKIAYEKMGDACSALNNFSKAVHFYHKMLECCEQIIKLTYSEELGIGFSDDLTASSIDLRTVLSPTLCKDLATCYISLSQTYKDNKQYELALKYFNKELTLQNNASEACRTLYNICEIYDLQEKSFTDIYTTYEKALNLAKKSNNKKLERLILTSMKSLCKENGRVEEMKKIEIELKSIQEVDSSSEEEVDETSDIQDDVNLDEISDLNNSEEEEEDKRVTRRRQNKNHFTIKRNDKGETALHVAAARGNLTLVRSLIKQGHPLNVRDAAGWLPLHEAANHGNVDVVAALLDAGADPNDKGETGLSPLHDAAASGHLEVIEILLEKGASIAQKTNKGETALDCLLECKARVEREQGKIAPDVEEHFKRVVHKLRVPKELTAMKNKIQVTKSQQESSRVSKYQENVVRNINESNMSPEELKRSNREIAQTRNLRMNARDTSVSPENNDHLFRRSTPALCSNTNYNSNSSDEESATREYQKAINNLRRNKLKIDLNKGKCYKPAISNVKEKQFLESTEVDDDWLENDLEQTNKKRKFDSYNEVRSVGIKNNTNKKVRNHDQTKTDKDKLISLKQTTKQYDFFEQNLFKQSNLPNVDLTKDFSQPLFPEDDDFILNSSETNKSPLSTHHSTNCDIEPHKYSSRHRLNRSCDSEMSVDRFKPEDDLMITQQDVNIIHRNRFEPNCDTSKNETIQTSHNVNKKQMINLKIKIQTHIFLIPIKDKNLDSLKINWLKTEASERYYRIEGITPLLRIKTQDGALVDDNDPLESIINEVLIETEVISWNKPPVINRYLQICTDLNVKIHKHIENTLKNKENCSSYTICTCYKSDKILHSLFKTLLNWNNLIELNLTRSFIKDKNVQILSENIINLNQLQTLNLSCNSITHVGIKYISENAIHLSSLKQLDLSFNHLTNHSMESINNILSNCSHLQILNLSNTQLTSNLTNVNFYNLNNINLSMNQLGRNEINRILTNLNCDNLYCLNLSHTSDKLCTISVNKNNFNPKESSEITIARSKSPNLYFDTKYSNNVKQVNVENSMLPTSRYDTMGNTDEYFQRRKSDEKFVIDYKEGENNKNNINEPQVNELMNSKRDVTHTDVLCSSVNTNSSIARECILFLEQSEDLPLSSLHISNINMNEEEAILLYNVLKTNCKKLTFLDISCNLKLSDLTIQMLKSLVD